MPWWIRWVVTGSPIRCAASPEGRLLVLGFTGRAIPSVKVNRLLLTNITVMGVATAKYWRTDPRYATAQWPVLLP